MRLFVAIPIPDTWYEQLEVLQTDIPDAWWVPSSLYHVTLQFLGEAIDDALLLNIVHNFEAIKLPSFEISVRGLGRFRTLDWSGVVWASVVEQPTLTQLHTEVVTSAEQLGIELEKETSFQPHVTLFYAGKADAEAVIESYVAHHVDFQLSSFRVREFVLYESVTVGDETKFIPRAAFSLDD